MAVGKTDYTTAPGIYKMYKKWKATAAVPKGRGRPMALTVEEMENAAKTAWRHDPSSSAFRLQDMKDAASSKKKEEAAAAGLDPSSINCKVSDSTAKTAMVAAAMGEDTGLTFTTKKLQNKTKKRFEAEHSPQGAYAHATTVLATHYREGPMPARLAKRFKQSELSSSVLETIDLMKEALGAEEVYTVDPNLVMFTDDVVIYAFESSSANGDEWEWKIVDKSSGNASVRSDFEVGSDAKNSGGLRVRLTFTMTGSGLMAPLYVSVGGLMKEELQPLP